MSLLETQYNGEVEIQNTSRHPGSWKKLIRTYFIADPEVLNDVQSAYFWSLVPELEDLVCFRLLAFCSFDNDRVRFLQNISTNLARH